MSILRDLDVRKANFIILVIQIFIYKIFIIK